MWNLTNFQTPPVADNIRIFKQWCEIPVELERLRLSRRGAASCERALYRLLGTKKKILDPYRDAFLDPGRMSPMRLFYAFSWVLDNGPALATEMIFSDVAVTAVSDFSGCQDILFRM